MEKLKTLILVRHGNYDPRGLTWQGRDQIAALAAYLLPLLENKTRTLYTSPTPRAQQSAGILARRLTCHPLPHSVFHSEDNQLEDSKMDEAIDLVKEAAVSSEVVIVVTHFEYMKWFPRNFAYNVLGGGYDWQRYGEIRKGGAAIINCEEISLEVVQPLG